MKRCPNGEFTHPVVRSDGQGCEWQQCPNTCRKDVLICPQSLQVVHRDPAHDCLFPTCTDIDAETDFSQIEVGGYWKNSLTMIQ